MEIKNCLKCPCFSCMLECVVLLYEHSTALTSILQTSFKTEGSFLWPCSLINSLQLISFYNMLILGQRLKFLFVIESVWCIVTSLSLSLSVELVQRQGSISSQRAVSSVQTVRRRVEQQTRQTPEWVSAWISPGSTPADAIGKRTSTAGWSGVELNGKLVMSRLVGMETPGVDNFPIRL